MTHNFLSWKTFFRRQLLKEICIVSTGDIFKFTFDDEDGKIFMIG